MRTRLALLWLAGCIDGGASSAGVGSSIEAPRVITVISSPSEVAPGDNVHLEAVVATLDHANTSQVQWSWCTTPRRPIDNTAVSPECARDGQGAPGAGPLEIDTRIPDEACHLFGSETGAGATPNAPDGTGGYYQPIRVQLGDAITVARIRIRCALAAAPIELAQAFSSRYAPNEPPSIGSLEALVAGERHPLSAVPRTRQVLVRATTSEPETYVRYDARRGQLERATETHTLSWFVSAGGITPEISELRSTEWGDVWEAKWTLPEGVSEAELWVVARDDRGASAVLQTFLRAAD